MKILDLLERHIETTIEPDAKYNGKFRRSFNDDSFEDGSGYYSSVRASRKDPHVVIKHNNNTESYDPYYDYIKYIIDNNLMDENIHFPRVYNVKKIRDKFNNVVYKFDIERLEHMDELSNEIIETIMNENFNEESFNAENYDNSENISQLAARMMSSFIIKGTKNKFIKSESLKEALSMLTKMRNEHTSWHLDLHWKNFMIRRTPVGYQIVLTDPFS